jgi:hypothetical protein
VSLRPVQRFLAHLLGTAVLATAGQVPALHTHVYRDHDHPEHHHGVAAHEHHPARHHDDPDDHWSNLESCDPGQHAVSLTMGCASVPPSQVVDADVPCPTLREFLVPIRSVVDRRDVRVHGPPPRSRIPARAPPITIPRLIT